MSLIDPVAPSIPPVMAETASEPTQKAVAVVGLGYVGLPTALGCHAAGMSVIGVDVSEERVEETSPVAPDLLDGDLAMLERARDDADHFAVVGDVAAIAKAACVLICVPTPIDERQTPNLAPLSKACVGRRSLVRGPGGGAHVDHVRWLHAGSAREPARRCLRSYGLRRCACLLCARADRSGEHTLCDDRCARRSSAA